MAAGRHLGFDPTGNGAVRSAVPETPTLETNTKSIGRLVAEIWPFEVFQRVNGPGPEVGRSVARSVGRTYRGSSIYTSYTDLIYSFATLGT